MYLSVNHQSSSCNVTNYSREHPVPRHPLRLRHELAQRRLHLLERGAHAVRVEVEGEVDVLLELAPDLLALLHEAAHAAVLQVVA